MSIVTNSSDAFVRAVASAIATRRWLEPGATVVVGVSGGADSVALLAALVALADEGGYRLVVAHLHHGLRDEADAEQRFVAELAGRWGLPFEARRCDVAVEARRRGEGVEQTGRRLRYEFLREVARAHGAGHVAVGHHADDQMETVLFRLARGCHLRGVAGMPASRELGEGVTLIRPLLGLRRAEVEAFCRRYGLGWCHDASNTDTAFQRNFIRRELLPLLERMNPQAGEAILHLAAAAAEAEGFLTGLGRAALARAEIPAASGPETIVLEAATLAREAPLVCRYAVRTTLERMGAPMGAVTGRHLRDLAAMVAPDGPAGLDLPGGWTARRVGGRLHIARAAAAAPPGEWEPVTLASPGRTVLPDGRTVVCDVGALDRAAFAAHCGRGGHDVEWLDADAIRGPLVCRPRRAGDAMRPLGCGGRRKLGRLLSDLKLSAKAREQVVCVGDETGLVACLPVRLDERVKVTDATRRVLQIRLLDGGQAEG